VKHHTLQFNKIPKSYTLGSGRSADALVPKCRGKPKRGTTMTRLSPRFVIHDRKLLARL
jgi:hypothetical protein